MVTAWAHIGKFLQGFFPLFYLKTPSSSSFNDVSEVPNYLQQVYLASYVRGLGLLQCTDSNRAVVLGIVIYDPRH